MHASDVCLGCTPQRYGRALALCTAQGLPAGRSLFDPLGAAGYGLYLARFLVASPHCNTWPSHLTSSNHFTTRLAHPPGWLVVPERIAICGAQGLCKWSGLCSELPLLCLQALVTWRTPQ